MTNEPVSQLSEKRAGHAQQPAATHQVYTAPGCALATNGLVIRAST
jgi:hypothetical protein